MITKFSQKRHSAKIGKLSITKLESSKSSNYSLILDLGCGNNKHKGAIGVDNVQMESVDVVRDLRNFPYPWNDNTIDKIYLVQVLEHFDNEMYLCILREIHRILKPGGILELRVPHVYGLGSFQNPTHKSFFTLHSMDYFSKNHVASYYKDFDFHFNIIERDIAVNCFYDWTRLTKLQKEINNFFTKILKRILRFSPTLCDAIIKILPFWYVDIGWILKKEYESNCQ